MPFGMAGGVGECRCVLDGGRNRRKGKGQFWGEFGRSIVANGNFVP